MTNDLSFIPDEDDQIINYTAFNKIKDITEANYSLAFTYGADHQRRKTVLTEGGTIIKTKYFLGAYEEEITVANGTRKLHYIAGGDGLAAVYIIENGNTTGDFNYTYTDHLGSIIAITDDTGGLLEEYSYGPWGRRRNAETWEYEPIINSQLSIINGRGYTGHEHLPEFGLINMNGRLYDPVLGRMLSPDNFVGSPDFTQSFNRFSYGLNNPLSYVDPDGNNPLLIGFLLGAFINTMMQDLQGNINNAGDMFLAAGIGGLSGLAGYGAGQLVAGAVGTIGFAGGALTGAAGGFVGGFVGGAGNAWALQGASFGQGLQRGLVSGGFGAITGGVSGGISGGISASKAGLRFWNGKPYQVDIDLDEVLTASLDQIGDEHPGVLDWKKTSHANKIRHTFRAIRFEEQFGDGVIYPKEYWTGFAAGGDGSTAGFPVSKKVVDINFYSGNKLVRKIPTRMDFSTMVHGKIYYGGGRISNHLFKDGNITNYWWGKYNAGAKFFYMVGSKTQSWSNFDYFYDWLFPR